MTIVHVWSISSPSGAGDRMLMIWGGGGGGGSSSNSSSKFVGCYIYWLDKISTNSLYCVILL